MSRIERSLKITFAEETRFAAYRVAPPVKRAPSQNQRDFPQLRDTAELRINRANLSPLLQAPHSSLTLQSAGS